MPYTTPPPSFRAVAIYVIDANTSEVVHIEQHVFPDITNDDARRAMASAIARFPGLRQPLRKAQTRRCQVHAKRHIVKHSF